MTSIKKILQRMLFRRDKQNEILRLDTKDVQVIVEASRCRRVISVALLRIWLVKVCTVSFSYRTAIKSEAVHKVYACDVFIIEKMNSSKTMCRMNLSVISIMPHSKMRRGLSNFMGAGFNRLEKRE
ncbi:hypothetical protein [Lonsdalea quercina]|uniref:hypothetical protein n=1 Tax=Lonsdalea quercina TaxID=71657 RepID=UPI003975EA35